MARLFQAHAPVWVRRFYHWSQGRRFIGPISASLLDPCLLYTSDAADERSSVDLGGRRIIKKKKKIKICYQPYQHKQS